MTYKESRNALFAETLIKALKSRHFDAYYCPTKDEAREKALSLIAPGTSVGIGGSQSLHECGLIEALYAAGKNTMLDRANVKTKAEKDELCRQMISADTYLMSTNAISQTGELVNIDGTGNRMAALCFGPRQVIIVVSLNKVAPTLETAIARARNTAAPLNAQRFPLSTPCRVNGICNDCKCPDSICAQFVVTRLCCPEGRIKVILCGEDMGF